jgi:AraC-like DNA-binding protein
MGDEWLIQFEYFSPDPAIRSMVSSYYQVTVPEGAEDIMRAEIANLRFVLRGSVASDINGQWENFGPGTALLCGPTYKSCNVRFAPDTQIFGAAITPAGWVRLFDMPADELADQATGYREQVTADNLPMIDSIFAAADTDGRRAATDAMFRSIADFDKRLHTAFLDQVTAWLTSPDPNELEDLLNNVYYSSRQVERLCKKYFGASPKKLHRKFRALHSANKLTWQDLSHWRDIATTAYSDQSHFIREFKQFNGRTPSEFINGAHLLVRLTLQERLQIEHESPFSLIG